jgi:ferritin-like metal-binding protein YciE
VATIKTMQASFLHELSDTYSAEHQLTEAMQGMLELATNLQVKQGLQRHIAETKQQIKNIDQVFKSFAQTPEDVVCKGAAGIISEFKSGAKDIREPALLDGFIVAGGLKGEHYEIATYRFLVAKAQLLGHADAAQLLEDNLQMEERFAVQLEQVDKQLGQELVRDKPELVRSPGSEPKAGKRTQ